MLGGRTKEWMAKNRWVWDHDVIPPSFGGLFGGLMQFEPYGYDWVHVSGRCIVSRLTIHFDVELGALHRAFETRDIRAAWPKATSAFIKFMEHGIHEDDAWQLLSFRRFVRPCWCAKDMDGDCGTEPCVFCEMKRAAPALDPDSEDC